MDCSVIGSMMVIIWIVWLSIFRFEFGSILQRKMSLLIRSKVCWSTVNYTRVYPNMRQGNFDTGSKHSYAESWYSILVPGSFDIGRSNLKLTALVIGLKMVIISMWIFQDYHHKSKSELKPESSDIRRSQVILLHTS